MRQGTHLASRLGAVLLLGGGFLLGCQSSALTSGKLYIKQEKYEQALEQLTLAVGTEPTNGEAYFHLGQVQGLLGDYDEMIAAFDRALELSPNYKTQITEQRLHYWSKVYNEGVRAAAGSSPDLGTASSHFALATRILPDRLRAWRNLAAVQYQLGEVDDAIASYEYVIEKAPEDTSTARTLGIVYLSQNRYDDARRHLEAVLEVGENRSALIDLAIIHMNQDRPADAEAALLRALAVDPECFECHYNLGNLYWNRDDYEDARASYAAAARLHPDDVDSRYNLAITYLALEQLDEALPLLQQLSEETPDNGVVWRELSRIHALQGRFAESEAANAKAEALGY